jgi:hypothetical protein
MTHLSDDLIDAAADGSELSPNETEHLRACGECRAAVARVQTLRARLAALPRTVEQRTDGWPQLRETIRARRADRVRRRAFVSVASLGLAAALVFAVVRSVPTPEANAPQAASELAELREIAPPVVVEAMAANLTIYDAALQELEMHAASDSENSDIRLRIDELRRKRAALLRVASQS